MDVQQDLGDVAAAQIHARSKIPVKFYKVDVRDESAVAEVISDVHKTYGSIDVLVNAAGIAEWVFSPVPAPQRLTAPAPTSRPRTTTWIASGA